MYILTNRQALSPCLSYNLFVDVLKSFCLAWLFFFRGTIEINKIGDKLGWIIYITSALNIYLGANFYKQKKFPKQKNIY